MSVQSEINRISGNVTAALAAIAEKGVSVPSGSKSDALAELIANIEAGGGDSGGGSQTINGKRCVYGTVTPTEDANQIIVLTAEELSALYGDDVPDNWIGMYWDASGFGALTDGNAYFAMGAFDKTSFESKRYAAVGTPYYFSGTDATRGATTTVFTLNVNWYLRIGTYTSARFGAGKTYCWMIIDI